MATFKKINKAEKSIILRNTYSDYIVKTSEYIKECEEIADIINVFLPAECYTNFRDALFHFFKLTRSMEESEIHHQVFAVREHANRAKNDAEVSLIDEFRQMLLWVLKHGSFDEGQKKILQKQLDCLGNYELDVRIHGMMLEDGERLSISDMEFFDIIENVLQNILQIAPDEFKDAQEQRKKTVD